MLQLRGHGSQIMALAPASTPSELPLTLASDPAALSLAPKPAPPRVRCPCTRAAPIVTAGRKRKEGRKMTTEKKMNGKCVNNGIAGNFVTALAEKHL